MVVGTLELRILVREAQTLKDKRRVIRSLKDRIGHRFPVSIAEVGALDHRQHGHLGVALVSNESRHAAQVLSKVADFVRHSAVAELVDYTIEIL